MIMTVPPSSLLSPSKKTLLLAAGVCAVAFPAAAQKFGEARVIQSAPAAAPAAPAPATRPATPVAPVTVQAAPAVVAKEARSFVQAYTARSGKIDQIPRWNQPVCVVVRGLVSAEAAKVAARIEDVARGVGLKVQKPGCQSNIQIMFTDQPQRMADSVGEAYLGYHSHTEIKKVRAVTHPIQGWYATATSGAAGATGLAFAGGSGTSQPSGGGMGLAGGPGSPAANGSDWESNFGQTSGTQLSMQVVDSPDHSAPTGCADSRFSSCMKSMFMNVLIVADNNAIVGKDMGVLTDYLAMLALSQPKSLDGCNALPSVIDVLAKPACADRDPPKGLTPADAAYLTGLYASDPEAKTTSAQGDIAGRMAKILIKAQGGAR
jgi:hypothetical protein